MLFNSTRTLADLVTKQYWLAKKAFLVDIYGYVQRVDLRFTSLGKNKLVLKPLHA